MGRLGREAVRAAAEGGWLALAGAVLLLTPLPGQPVPQQGPIEPGSQTVAQPKPKAAAQPAAKDAKSPKKAPAATGQSGSATRQGASTQSWSTQSAAQPGASTQGGWSTQGENAPAASTQGWPQQGSPTQNKTQAPAAAQLPLRPDANAQQGSSDETPVFRSDVRLVRMLATVRDPGGALAGGLKREEFRIIDSGVPQELAVFEATTEQPLSVAILIDCSASMASFSFPSPASRTARWKPAFSAMSADPPEPARAKESAASRLRPSETCARAMAYQAAWLSCPAGRMLTARAYSATASAGFFCSKRMSPRRRRALPWNDPPGKRPRKSSSCRRVDGRFWRQATSASRNVAAST